MSVYIDPGKRTPDSFEIVDGRINGYYNSGPYTWTHSTPIVKIVPCKEFTTVMTKSGSVYTLYYDRWIGVDVLKGLKLYTHLYSKFY